MSSGAGPGAFVDCIRFQVRDVIDRQAEEALVSIDDGIRREREREEQAKWLEQERRKREAEAADRKKKIDAAVAAAIEKLNTNPEIRKQAQKVYLRTDELARQRFKTILGFDMPDVIDGRARNVWAVEQAELDAEERQERERQRVDAEKKRGRR